MITTDLKLMKIVDFACFPIYGINALLIHQALVWREINLSWLKVEFDRKEVSSAYIFDVR